MCTWQSKKTWNEKFACSIKGNGSRTLQYRINYNYFSVLNSYGNSSLHGVSSTINQVDIED
ncbi:MAG: hypothetical protein R3B93_20060 [Bacteroidia bacterium]